VPRQAVMQAGRHDDRNDHMRRQLGRTAGPNPSDQVAKTVVPPGINDEVGRDGRPVDDRGDLVCARELGPVDGSYR
jgi:hypothetical protein